MKYFLSVLALLSFVAMFVFGSEPPIPWLKGKWVEPWLYRLHYPNGIVFNLAVGFLISLFFWLLVGYLPERKKRAILRRRLTQRYANFKIGVVQNLVWAAGGSLTIDEIESLTEPAAFRDYFSTREGGNRYAAMNGMEETKDYLREIHLELSLLAAEMSFALQMAPLTNQQNFERFMNFTSSIERQGRSPMYRNEDVKYTFGLVYSLLARWSIVEGQRSEDVVQEMINAL